MPAKDAIRQDHLSQPDRRTFLRTLGAGALGLAAGLPASRAQAVPLGAVLDPGAPVRIGMIGTAGHTDTVLGSLDRVPGAVIAAYAFEDSDWEYNEDGTRRGGSYPLDQKRKWAEKQRWFGPKTRLYETYQEMLDKEKLDLAAVCLPYSRIPFAGAAAARAGLHVISEKPVATTFADLDMLQSAVKKSGVRLTALFTIRYSPAFYTIRQAVAAGKIGRPILGWGQKSYKWGEERPWFYKQRKIYGGSILWVGIHAIDYIYWTMGLDVKKVSAFHGNLAHPDYPGCQDHGVV
ncbi:MAG: Gfo/Idh/MocA family oxidoreductase, partial [Candidatus Glassbacteria bacterium]